MLIGYHWANGLSISNEGIGLQLSRQPDLQYGVALKASLERKEGDSIYLKGMGDVDQQVVLAGYVNTAITKNFSLGANLELGSGNTHGGALLTMGALYSLPLSDKLGLNLSVKASFANADYMANYFGVNAAQAAASGYMAYTPSAGLRNIALGAGLNYQITPQWGLTAGVSASTLSNAARSSPLVHQNSSFSGLVGLTYTF